MRTGMPKINREELGECFVAWPGRIEQDAIMTVLDALDARQDSEVVSLQKACNLKAGLMNDLLTGRVRVTPLLA